MPTSTTTIAHSGPAKRACRAHVRGPGAPKPRDSIATARVVARRSASTSRANAVDAPRRSRPWSASPRARRAIASWRQSSPSSVVIRTAARAPSTKRAGSRSSCASPSARSVGSTPTKSTTAGSPTASTRSAVASASVSDPSVTCAKPRSNHSRPEGRPYSAMLSAVRGTATSTGDARSSRVRGGMRSTGRRSSSSASATAADTTSRLVTRHTPRASTPSIAATGWTPATPRRVRTGGTARPPWSARVVEAVTGAPPWSVGRRRVRTAARGARRRRPARPRRRRARAPGRGRG